MGALFFNGLFSLAYDSLGGTLFGLDAASDQLIRINTTTGIGTAIGPIGGSLVSIVGLDHDESSGTLYAFDNATDQLVTIDKATGVGSAVGAVGFGATFGLAFDPMTGDLFGADLNAPSQLLTINPFTGAGTAIGPLVGGGSSGITGLAFAPAVPVPGTLLLLLSGLSAVATLRFRRQESS